MSSSLNFAEYYQPKPKQIIAHQCPYKYVLFGGAMGGGKSYFLCAEAIIQALRYPGNRCVLIRETRTVLLDTTFVTFLKICPPELLIKGKPNMSPLEARFKNGSVIMFKGVDIRKDKLLQGLKGSEYGWAGIDEANEIPKKVFDVLKSRLRWVLPDGSTPSYRIRLTSNPEKCWLKTVFIEQKRKNHVFIQSLTTDNYDIDSEYIKQLYSAYGETPELLARYLEGSWEDGDAINQLFTLETKRLLHKNKPKNSLYNSLGVDVARYGEDRTVFVRFDGNLINSVKIFAKTSIPEVYRETVAICSEHKIKGFRTGVDTVGMGGGVADMCKEAGLNVQELVGGASGKDLLPETSVKPANFRAAMFIALKNDIRDGDIAFGPLLPNEMKEAILSELSMILYDFESDMRWRILKKEEIKQKYGISPDIVDALAYANWVRRAKEKAQPSATIFFGGSTNHPPKK